MAIAFREGQGSLWWNQIIRLSPRFEIRMKIIINSNGCYDAQSYSIDGFALILSKQKNFLGGPDNEKGYGGIYDALVTEIDLNGNPGEISSNFIRLNRCYGQYCRPNTPGSTSQNLPFGYNRCQIMTYDVKLKYSNYNLNIYVNDHLLISSNENLLTKFQGFSQFGISGYFRGDQRELIVSKDSYICTDQIKSVYIETLHQTIRSNNIIPNDIPAGSTIEVSAQFRDQDNQKVPHFKQYDIIDWKLNTSYDCGIKASWNPNQFVDNETIKFTVKI